MCVCGVSACVRASSWPAGEQASEISSREVSQFAQRTLSCGRLALAELGASASNVAPKCSQRPTVHRHNSPAATRHTLAAAAPPEARRNTCRPGQSALDAFCIGHSAADQLRRRPNAVLPACSLANRSTGECVLRAASKRRAPTGSQWRPSDERPQTSC